MKKLVASFICMLACSGVFAQNITVDLKDAPVRTTIEMIFKQAGIKNYVIENSVAGFVTMKLEDQPFENSLKLVMRAATIPLTYLKENDVWIVKQRIITPTPQTSGPDLLPENILNKSSFERIPLTYIDPFDLQIAFGFILNISQFQRFSGGMGMMGGGQSGGMGSFGGGMNGGMNGGMGGFGGGRNF